MAAPAGRFKGKFISTRFRVIGPIVRSAINKKVLNDITCTAFGFGEKILKEIAMGKMAIRTLRGKAPGILSAMNSLLPCGPEGLHHMTCRAKGVFIGRFNHVPGCKYHHDG